MKKSFVAALLSGLIFPGLGIWYLGFFTRSLIFAIPALFSFSYLVHGIWTITQTVIYNASQSYIDQVFLTNNWQIDWLAIAHEVKIHLDKVPELYQAQWILFAAWFLSIVVSFVLGQQQEIDIVSDKTQPSSTPNPTISDAEPLKSSGNSSENSSHPVLPTNNIKTLDTQASPKKDAPAKKDVPPSDP